MRILPHLFLLFLLSAVEPLRAEGETPSAPAAEEVMRRVRDNLPQSPLVMRGELRSGPLRGGFDHTYYVEIRLDLGRRPMTADYILRDRFGGVLEQMRVLRHGPAEVDLRYTKGDQPASDTPPPPHEHIQATDVAWDDLTLSFLWWPATRLIGRDTFRGRDCLVLELAPQNAAPAAADAATAGAGLPETRRLWVDEKMFVFLQMEVWLADRSARRLMVRCFKKIGEQWMIKDLEMRALGLSHRTLLRVEEMSGLPETAAPAEEGASSNQ